MLNSKTVAKAGNFVIIDHGEYSDYCIIGLFRVAKDFIPCDVLDNYLEQNPRERRDYAFQEDKFVNYLCINGYLDELSFDTFYLGGYGNVDGVDYRPYGPIEVE